MNSRKRIALNRGCLDWLYTDYNHIMAPHKAMSQEILPMALGVDKTRRKMNSTSASQDKYPHCSEKYVYSSIRLFIFSQYINCHLATILSEKTLEIISWLP